MKTVKMQLLLLLVLGNGFIINRLHSACECDGGTTDYQYDCDETPGNDSCVPCFPCTDAEGNMSEYQYDCDPEIDGNDSCTPCLAIVLDNIDEIIAKDASVTLGSTPSGGSGGNTFAWEVDGSAANGSTSEDPGSTSFTIAGGHTIRVTVTDSAGNTASDSKTIHVPSVTVGGDVWYFGDAWNTTFKTTQTVTVAHLPVGTSYTLQIVDSGTTTPVVRFSNNTQTITSTEATQSITATNGAATQSSLTVKLLVTNTQKAVSTAFSARKPVFFSEEEGDSVAIVRQQNIGWQQVNTIKVKDQFNIGIPGLLVHEKFDPNPWTMHNNSNWPIPAAFGWTLDAQSQFLDMFYCVVNVNDPVFHPPTVEPAHNSASILAMSTSQSYKAGGVLAPISTGLVITTQDNRFHRGYQSR